jgi:hypothetical protein
MQILAPTPLTPQPPRQPAAPPAGRGAEVDRLYRQDLLALPGALSTQPDPSDPNALDVRFETPELRMLADNVLRDGVAGATLVLQDPSATRGAHRAADRDDTPWYDKWANVARAIAAMPGVVSYGYSGRMGDSTVFTTTTQEVADHLEALVSPHIGASTVYFVPLP